MSSDLPRLFARIAREIAHLEAVRDRLLEGCDAVEPAWIRANADDPVQWTDLNSIRNTLVHEYLEDPAFMAQQIEAAVPLVDRIAQDFQRLRAWAERYIDLRNEAGPRR